MQKEGHVPALSDNVTQSVPNIGQKSVTAWLVLLGVVACSSYDLGDKPPDKFIHNQDVSTWEGGVGSLVQNKCASCHNPSKGDFVPANTPDIIDGMGREMFYTQEQNLGKIQRMKQRILSKQHPMPPAYATPLTDLEETALVSFLENRVAALSQAPEPETMAEGESEGESEPESRAECAEFAGEASENLQFAEIQPIVQENCALSGCHGGEQPGRGLPSFEDRSSLSEHRAMAFDFVLSGRMPPGQPDFEQSTAGQMLLRWLCLQQP